MEAQMSDKDLAPMFEYKEQGILPEDRNRANTIMHEAQYYKVDDGILYLFLYQPRSKGHRWTDVKKQLAVPFKFMDAVLKSYHNALSGGHYGIEKTYDAIRIKFFWPSMYKDIKIYCQSCESCQETKRYINHKKHYFNLYQ